MTDVILRRIFAWILMFATVFGASVMLFSCDEVIEDGGEVIEESGEASESDAETTEAVDVTEVAEVTEAPKVTEYFRLSEDVRIVYPHGADDMIKGACKKIAAAVFEVYGFDLKMVSDWGYAEGGEIIVGNCGYRESSVEFNDEIYADGYRYAVLSENEVAISARSSEGILAAAELFVKEIIRGGAEPAFVVGAEGSVGNERPDVNYTLNGVKLEEYSIVVDDVDDKAAEYLKEEIKQNFYINLKIVSSAAFGGGHAIKIGSFGTKSYGGYRYRVGSEVVGGTSVIYIDGENKALCEEGAKFLFDTYLDAEGLGAELSVPENVYSYRWVQNNRNTGAYFDSLLETKVLAEGVTYYRMKYIGYEGGNVDVYAIVVEGSSKAEFRVWAGDLASIYEGKEVLTVKTVGDQARDLDKSSEDDVIAAINAGYFDINATNYPGGMRIIDGKVLCLPGEASRYPDRWFGITYDGKFVCGNAEDYKKNWEGKIVQGVGTGNPMMIDGKVDFSNGIHGSTTIGSDGNPNLAPYSAVASTTDGGFILVAVDGRPWKGKGSSEGITSVDMLGIILDLEAFYPEIEFEHAIILDGGGSTEMVTERKAGSDAFVTMNNPCDLNPDGTRGKSRKVGDIIAIVIPKE